MKIRLPSSLGALYWRLRQRRLQVQPWSAFGASLPFQGRSLAIVGNAGYLKDLRQGEIIDEHDLVLRMNNFAVAGYEAAVGSRLDIFLTNFYHDVDLTNPLLGQARAIVSSTPNNFRKRRQDKILNRHGQHITIGMLRMQRRTVHVPDLVEFQGHVARFGRYPTSGATAIIFALGALAPESGPIYITGFSFFAGQSHYFSDRRVDPATNHDMPSEKRELRILLGPAIASGQVTLDSVMAEHLELPSQAKRRAS